MTGVLDRPRADAGTRRRVERPKPSRTARLRVAVRIARRQVRRTWVSSLLIMTLIALPIAGMAGVAVYVNSMIATPEERVAVQLGEMQGWVAPIGVPDAGFWQAPDEPYSYGYGTGPEWTSEAEGEPLSDPTSALPAGTETIEVSQGRERVQTSAGIAAIRAWAGEIGDPRFTGRFDMVSGNAPNGDGEVMVTTATLDRVGARVGGELRLVDSDDVLRIVGTFDAAELADTESAVAFPDADRFEGATWYLPETSLSWTEIRKLNEQGIGVYSREVVLDPPAFSWPDGSQVYTAATAEEQGLLALAAGLGAGGLAAAYMVVMLAGAAFAVSARRQQRALAIAASVGADTRDVRRIVLLQGTVLGLVAGGVGLAAGIGLAAVVMRLTDNGSAMQFWGFHVPWVILIGILLFSTLVGTASAFVPARSVGRSDTISALRGARRPQRVNAARPLWGSLLILVGVVVTILCGVAAAAVAADTMLPWDSPFRWLPVVGIIAGPVLAQVGILISGRWLLWLASRLLSRFGIAARMASRDAVANGARTVPAFAAIGATVFVGVFAVGVGMMSAGTQVRTWDYSAPIGTVTADVSSMDGDQLDPTVRLAVFEDVRDAFEQAGATATALVQRQYQLYWSGEEDIPGDAVRATVMVPQRNLLSGDDTDQGWSGVFGDPTNNIAVMDASDVPTVMGVELSAADKRAFEQGAALITDSDLITDGRIDVAAWTAQEWATGKAPDNIFAPANDAAFAEPQWRTTLPAIALDAPDQPLSVVLHPSAAEELGLNLEPTALFAAMPEDSPYRNWDRAYALGDSLTTDDHSVYVSVETGPPSPAVWLVPLLAAVAVLVLGASAVALGLARFERRPDDATLAAVGGTPGLRRRIGLWQGLVIAGFGTFAGAAAGILPPIGFWLQSQTGYEPMSLADIPWWLLGALAVALPLGIAAVNWLVPPREPELTRRNVIA